MAIGFKKDIIWKTLLRVFRKHTIKVFRNSDYGLGFHHLSTETLIQRCSKYLLREFQIDPTTPRGKEHLMGFILLLNKSCERSQREERKEREQRIQQPKQTQTMGLASL